MMTQKGKRLGRIDESWPRNEIALFQIFQIIFGVVAHSCGWHLAPLQSKLPDFFQNAVRMSIADRYLFHLHRHVYVTFYPENQVMRMASNESLKFAIVHVAESDGTETCDLSAPFHVPSLSEIFKFDQMMNRLVRRNPTQKILICTGTETHLRVKAAFLGVCHSIISHHIDCNQAYNSLLRLCESNEVLQGIKGKNYSVRSCLLAVQHASRHNWIDFDEKFDSLPFRENSIDMDEYLHYARLFKYCSSFQIVV